MIVEARKSSCGSMAMATPVPRDGRLRGEQALGGPVQQLVQWRIVRALPQERAQMTAPRAPRATSACSTSSVTLAARTAASGMHEVGIGGDGHRDEASLVHGGAHRRARPPVRCGPAWPSGPPRHSMPPKPIAAARATTSSGLHSGTAERAEREQGCGRELVSP